VKVVEFVRRVPVLDLLFFIGVGLTMTYWWKKVDVVNAEEVDRDRRQLTATAVTNQVNALLTANSIVLAGVGSVLAIGLGRQFPRPSLEHFLISAAWALTAIVLGVYILGYIPSVIHRLDVARKPPVMITCTIQISLTAAAAVRFLGGLWQLSQRMGTD
jgi:hypothetical protein